VVQLLAERRHVRFVVLEALTSRESMTMPRAARPTKVAMSACWSGPLLLGLQRLPIELRRATTGGRDRLPGTGRSRPVAARRLGTPEERLEILGFVATGELSWIHLDRPYFVSTPDTDSRLFSMLCEILLRSDRIAVGQLVLSRRRQMVAVYACRGALVMHTLRGASDTVRPHELGVGFAAGETWTPGPWNTVRELSPSPARGRAGRRKAAGGDAARVLDFSAALARRRARDGAARRTPRQSQRCDRPAGGAASPVVACPGPLPG
jgi:hypothetical protein